MSQQVASRTHTQALGALAGLIRQMQQLQYPRSRPYDAWHRATAASQLLMSVSGLQGETLIAVLSAALAVPFSIDLNADRAFYRGTWTWTDPPGRFTDSGGLIGNGVANASRTAVYLTEVISN